MKKQNKIILAVILLVFLILAWSPWLNNKNIYNNILDKKGILDGTISKTSGELLCDYKVMWFPFGRWVASCEGGYFVTFYGGIL